MPTQQDWINVLTAVLILLLLIICFVVIINVVEVIAHAITKVIDS